MPVKKITPQDFELHSGNDVKLKFTTLDQDDAVVDLTGGTVVFALSRTARNKTPLFTYTSPTNVTITDAVNGLFEVDVLDTDTEVLKGAEYYYEVRVSSSAGLKTTVAYGTITMLDNLIDT